VNSSERQLPRQTRVKRASKANEAGRNSGPGGPLGIAIAARQTPAIGLGVKSSALCSALRSPELGPTFHLFGVRRALRPAPVCRISLEPAARFRQSLENASVTESVRTEVHPPAGGTPQGAAHVSFRGAVARRGKGSRVQFQQQVRRDVDCGHGACAFPRAAFLWPHEFRAMRLKESRTTFRYIN
jgi:hypothetical protein